MFKKFKIYMMFHVKHIKEIFKIVPCETILKICHSDNRKNLFKNLNFSLNNLNFRANEVSL